MRPARVLPQIDPPPSVPVPFSGEVLTVRQAVERFKLGRDRLVALCHSGEVAAVQPGKRLLICAESVRAFLRRQCEGVSGLRIAGRV